MIDIYKDPQDPLWEMMDFFTNPFERKINNSGLKSAISRPHNLVNIKDANGKVIGQRLAVVTTPFKKEDVKVKIIDNMLSVECGSENIKDDESEEVIYRGISSQAYTFKLKLAPSVDKSKITAENKDGILKIDLPLLDIEKKDEPIEIDIA